MSAFDYSKFSSGDAAFLRETGGQIRALIRRAVPLNVKIGDHLAKVRERLPHGLFGIYCVAEVQICLRSAENYMNLAELAKLYPVSLLSRLPARAGYKLAEKATPAPLVAEVMAEVAGGRTFTLRDVEGRIAASVSAKPAVVVPDVDEVAGWLKDALDPENVADLIAFLRSAKKAQLTQLCERLLCQAEQPLMLPTAASLPRPEL